LRPVVSRAAKRAASVEIEAESSMCPCQDGGRPSSCAVQRRHAVSSSVAAGDVRQMKATLLSAAASSSARMPGPVAVDAK
jgi:hypothetical protein